MDGAAPTSSFLVQKESLPPAHDGFLVPATAKSITENIEPILKTIKDFVFKEYFLALARKYWMMTKYNGRMSKHGMSKAKILHCRQN